MEIYQEIAELIVGGGSGVLVTVVAVAGTTPRKPGAKMLVRADRTLSGSIGGGAVEKEAQRLALEVLATGEPRLVSLDEGGDGGLACGGKLTVFLEPFAAGPSLFIVGNGHVGQALAVMAVSCGWRVRVFDDRSDPGTTSGQFYPITGYDDPFSGLLPGKKSCVVIASRSHEFDLQALRASLATEAGFIGLLGSRHKKESFFATLAGDGVTTEQLDRVETPVGVSIGAKTPAEIAISIMAGLIAWQGKT
jgi:xanthine dehydrogenase accessory factor